MTPETKAPHTPAHPCICGHEKGDHQTRIGRGNYTPCCVTGCTCSGFRKQPAPPSRRLTGADPMTDAKAPHTPGPWKAVVDIAEHPQWFRVDAADGGICVPCYGREPRGIDEANARLIAAAPDLLDVVKRLRQWDMLDATADGPYWKGELDAAIAKAEGRE